MNLPTKTIETRYDYYKVLPWFIKNASKIIGREYVIPSSERAIVFAMLAWMLRDDLVADEMGFDLNKGILLTGPIGCGKTTLFKILKECKLNKSDFEVISSRQVVSEFLKDGFDIIDKYSFTSNGDNVRNIKSFCFDDLGTEKITKYFGNDCNVMGEILLSRYELFKQKKTITHITTNLSAKEIETLYGKRIRSRMREMFNLFGYEETSVDKRK